jgi:hypothetical protein
MLYCTLRDELHNILQILHMPCVFIKQTSKKWLRELKVRPVRQMSEDVIKVPKVT